MPVYAVYVPVYAVYVPVYAVYVPVYAVYLPVYAVYLPVCTVHVPVYTGTSIGLQYIINRIYFPQDDLTKWKSSLLKQLQDLEGTYR